MKTGELVGHVAILALVAGIAALAGTSSARSRPNQRRQAGRAAEIRRAIRELRAEIAEDEPDALPFGVTRFLFEGAKNPEEEKLLRQLSKLYDRFLEKIQEVEEGQTGRAAEIRRAIRDVRKELAEDLPDAVPHRVSALLFEGASNPEEEKLLRQLSKLQDRLMEKIEAVDYREARKAVERRARMKCELTAYISTDWSEEQPILFETEGKCAKLDAYAQKLRKWYTMQGGRGGSSVRVEVRPAGTPRVLSRW
jgi:hypothetical protein